MTQSSISYTARLLNHIEPYYIDGIAKSAFYTEVNTNIKKNSKVFILNGYHDSEIFISKGKYAKNADGYKVLYSDKCKIVLDIDFSGTQSYSESEFDKYIKVYNIRSQREFDYINKLQIDSYTASRYSKFEKGYTNNIIYSNKTFAGNFNGIGSNSGISTSGSFWARIGMTWSNVTNQFNYNTFTFSSDYYAIGLTNNGRVYVVGEDIKYGGNTYKEKNIYKLSDESISNSWKIDINYKQPIITRLNFRQGVFKGIHNDGIFGSYLKEETWTGLPATWNSGFFVNSKWNSGIMKSKSTTSEPSYYSILENGKVVQTTDFSNNKSFGYNYAIDSNIYAGELINGNFINCNIGLTTSGLTAIDQYFNNNITFPVSTSGGLYNYCDIHSSKISSSTTLDSIIDNTYLYNTKTLNSQLTESYSKGGEFSINNGIPIISSDIVSYVINGISATESNIRGVLKLYISDKDYNRLDTFDNFYISKINKDYILSSLNSDQKIVLPYETRYVLDTFWDFRVSGVNQECLAILKTKFDNKSRPQATFNGSDYVTLGYENENQFASIDIDLGQYLAFYFYGEYIYLNQSLITKGNVQKLFLNTHISNSDFRNGVIEGIKWTSGSNVNYPSNIIKNENNKLKISKTSSDEISIHLNEYIPTIDDGQLKIGSYVWLDSIKHISNSGTTDISGCYTIISTTSLITPNETIIVLKNSLVSSLSMSGTYSISNDNLSTYTSINKLLIDSSEINTGLFIRTLFKNSTFTNDEFNNLDTKLSNNNIDRLRLINQVFSSNNNTVKSGLIHKSHILNVNWVSGISNNSIWNGPTFGNGVFNSGYWQDGIFNNGYFQNSKDLTLTNIDYSEFSEYKNWLNGTFNNGIFHNSSWIDGTFNNGKLYNSNWYGGIWNNGILGDKNIPTLNTNMGQTHSDISGGATQTFWYNGIVENANIGGYGSVYWYDGKFNNGIFTSENIIDSNESIWYGGDFNGGNFSKLARWRDGTFNNGKFTSYYGWDISSTYSTDYSWENGSFNGGIFGLASYATNSTWYNGSFNGGIFQGRLWNNGVFQNGTFNGGSIYSAVLSEYDFNESFTQSYYGLWLNGYVTNIKHKSITDELIADNNLRNIEVEPQKIASLNNMLWVNGTFDHANGSMNNSLWLNGSFRGGLFNASVFNPYIKNHWEFNYIITSGSVEVAATASITITGTASIGDNVIFYINNNLIAYYTATASETITILADEVENSLDYNNINDYTIDRYANTLVITANPGLGNYGNLLQLTSSHVSNIIDDIPSSATVSLAGMTDSFLLDTDVIIVTDFDDDISNFTYNPASSLVDDIVNSINTNTLGYTSSIIGSQSFHITTYPKSGDTLNGRHLKIYNSIDTFSFTFSNGITIATSSYIPHTINPFAGGVDAIDPISGQSFNNSLDDCIWENGSFNNGLFYISDWLDGKFINGTMSGARWVNGEWSNGYAKNIYWENGIWKNGIWNGSPFDSNDLTLSNTMKPGMNRDMVLRVSNILREGKLHIVNAFTGSYKESVVIDGGFKNINVFYGWTASGAASVKWTPATLPTKGLQLNNTIPVPIMVSTFINRVNSSIDRYRIQVSLPITPGDIYYSEIYFYSTKLTGRVSVTAELGDTVATLSQKISNRIALGMTTRIVETRTLTNIITYKKWSELYGSNLIELLNRNSYPSPTYSISDNCVYVNTLRGYTLPTAYPVGITKGVYDTSDILYALSTGGTSSVFSVDNANYDIQLEINSMSGRSDFIITIGNETHYETLTSKDNIFFYSYTHDPSLGNNRKFSIQRINYNNPDNSILLVTVLNIHRFNSSYLDNYNNKLYQFATFSIPFEYGPTGSSIQLPNNIVNSLLSLTTKMNIGSNVSVNYGNGVFKSGIWENGYWNNGWRSIWKAGDKDYYLFNTPVTSIEISPSLWSITIYSFDGDMLGLEIGDKVSIGNIVCIDPNEDRKLIKDFYRIVNKGVDFITVQVSLNTQVRRIAKESDIHLIYVTKNVWLSGIFHNGYFKGVWNYGLFKGHPYITKMEDSQWIDGIFDGGRFISSQSDQYQVGGELTKYNTGLIQNFIFVDNNDEVPYKFAYNSWVDINYITQSMTNIFKDNIKYDYEYDVSISDGNLRGYPTPDVLSSDSIFRNTHNEYHKYYKLGTKYKIYNDFISDSSYFNYPIKTNGIPGPDDFIENSWTYSNNSLEYHSNIGNNDDNQLVVNYNRQVFSKIGIKAVQVNKVEYWNTNYNISDGVYENPDHLRRDLSDNKGYKFLINGVEVLGKRFSNLSFTASQWHFKDNSYLSADTVRYPVSLRWYPGNNIQSSSPTGNTNNTTKRVYMIDWFNVGTTQSTYGGYDNSGLNPNQYYSYTKTTTLGTFSVYYYQAITDTYLTINAFVPFTFKLHEADGRGGWSTFKFIGVVEKCITGTASIHDESAWEYVTSTKLDYYGNTGDYNYAGASTYLDKDRCCILHDGDRNSAFLGKLYINNFKFKVQPGDKIRFRVYLVNVRKLFACSPANDGPGSFYLSIGVDPSMGYFENNNGYFEIYDDASYINLNTNLLDNTLSRDIEKFRYSIVDFDMIYNGHAYQGPIDVLVGDNSLPTVYLLNDKYYYKIPGNSKVINHALTPSINKKEYFYNRKSLQLLFKSTEGFEAHFNKISFYETDMIPFFRYTTEENVDKRIKTPYYGTQSNNISGSITLDNKFIIIENNSNSLYNITNDIEPINTDTTTTTTTTFNIYARKRTVITSSNVINTFGNGYTNGIVYVDLFEDSLFTIPLSDANSYGIIVSHRVTQTDKGISINVGPINQTSCVSNETIIYNGNLTDYNITYFGWLYNLGYSRNIVNNIEILSFIANSGVNVIF